jgi:hypothetical protein
MGRARADTPQRVLAVRESGPELASQSCSGKIGRLKIQPVRISVHPGGMILKPIFMQPRAVRAGEIETIARMSAAVGDGVVITHEAPDVSTPIALALGENSAVEAALRSLESSRARLGS